MSPFSHEDHLSLSPHRKTVLFSSTLEKLVLISLKICAQALPLHTISCCLGSELGVVVVIDFLVKGFYSFRQLQL